MKNALAVAALSLLASFSVASPDFPGPSLPLPVERAGSFSEYFSAKAAAGAPRPEYAVVTRINHWEKENRALMLDWLEGSSKEARRVLLLHGRELPDTPVVRERLERARAAGGEAVAVEVPVCVYPFVLIGGAVDANLGLLAAWVHAGENFGVPGGVRHRLTFRGGTAEEFRAFLEGALASMPAPGQPGRFVLVTDHRPAGDEATGALLRQAYDAGVPVVVFEAPGALGAEPPAREGPSWSGNWERSSREPSSDSAESAAPVEAPARASSAKIRRLLDRYDGDIGRVQRRLERDGEDASRSRIRRERDR